MATEAQKNIPPASQGETLANNITVAEQKIKDFNEHWMNHKHLFPAVAIALMVLIYLGMIEPGVEMFVWPMSGLLIAGLIGLLVFRDRLAKKLNGELDAAQAELKEFEKMRRKKRRKKK